MEPVRLTLVGAGSVRCSVPVIGSLGSYFGERPLEIALYDADAERLELFELFARVVFSTNKAPHLVFASTRIEEALENAQKVILQVDDNCSLKEFKAAGLKPPKDTVLGIEATLARLVQGIHNEAQVVSLQNSDVRIPLSYYYRIEWPNELDESERRSVPHQVMRWIRGEDYLFDLLAKFDRSPLKRWLDDVNTATVVSEA